MKPVRKFFTVLLFALTAIVLHHCANPVSPGGGPKDDQPPQVVASSPPNNTVLFNKKRISIEFDEYVKLKNPNQQVLISPPFSSKPEFKLRGKSLIIDIEEELLPNTTYSIFFGNAIVDLTEDNPLVNYLYAFSTGDYIDSLAIAGEIVNAFDLKPRENIFVMLFPASIDTIPEDSIPMLSRPLYVAKTDASGQFQLRYLRNENYRLFALNDVNSNYLFDQPNEEIAFLDSLINPEIFKTPAIDTSAFLDSLASENDTTQSDSLNIRNSFNNYYQLFMFQQVDSTQRFLDIEVFYPPKFRINYLFAADEPKYKVLNQNPGNDWKIEQLSKGRDSLTVWVNDMNLDSLQLEIADGDSIFDTVMISFGKAREAAELKKGKRKKDDELIERLQIKTNARGRILDLGKQLRLIMGNPLKSWNFSTTFFVAGQDTMTGAPFKVIDSIASIFELEYEMTEETTYEFIFPDSIFMSIYDVTNDSLQASFTTGKISDYGNLVLNLEIGEYPYLIQLLDKKENKVKEFYITESQTLKIEYLRPDSFLLKAVQDAHRNKRWDTGVYTENRQAENVFYFPLELQVRANWDVEESWKLP
ncbi:MAG: Ig-like domain-containing protein [Bacteroidales bacterium]|nr:Ig-like domain-containing protein [Bacteroidales bacterium]